MKPGRNDPCSCGSGKKYKHCCEGKIASRAAAPAPEEFNQLVGLYNAKRFAELESRAGALAGRYPDAGLIWKLLGVSLQMQGKDALPAFQKTAQLMPADADAQYILGNVLKDLGQLDEAVASYRRALKIKPDFAEAYNNMGLALRKLGQVEDAMESYHSALKIKPDLVEAHNNIGNVLRDTGRHEEAIASYRRALQIKPNYAEAHNNSGLALHELRQFDSAAASYRRAIELKPDYAEAHYNLGVTLHELLQFDSAVTSYRRALELNPDYVDAHNNLGLALGSLGHFGDAQACFRKALEIKPDFVEAHNNLGSILNQIGQLDDAVASFRNALAYDPDYAMAQANVLSTLNYSKYSSEYCLAEARKYGQMVAKKVASRFSTWQCEGLPERLRVGMVSGRFCSGPTGYFLENLLTHLDPLRLELIAYPTTIRADALTARIKPRFVSWKPLVNMKDEAAAQLIHADGVHILLDLAGHSGHNRLPMFAWKPAPVQVNWLDYFATTGVDEIDFLLADPVSVPETHRNHFTETIWYLPDTRLCFTPPETVLPVAPLPAQKMNHLTFGCFQTLPKIGDSVLAAWEMIFAALPGARLRMQCKQLGDQGQVELMMARLKQHGISPARVELHGSVPRETYLAAHAEVDMILDTFPYPGGTTTCEALWMGVPTLTLAGDTLLSRQGASLLTAAGLSDWIANDKGDYIAKAIEFASDVPGLAALRAGLREKVKMSPLFDAARFARNFEDVLWGMWRARSENP